MLNKVYEAIFLTLKNAQQLFSDGELLHNSGSIRAYIFYHFSFEESGLLFILMRIMFDDLLGTSDYSEDGLSYKYLKEKGYEHHLKKLDESVLKLVAMDVYKSVLNYDDESTGKLEKRYNELKSSVSRFNKQKNQAIYITFNGNKFLMPEEVINSQRISEMKELALDNCQMQKNMLTS